MFVVFAVFPQFGVRHIINEALKGDPNLRLILSISEG